MKTLIFDFDGTIANSFETLLTIFEDITKRPEKLTVKEINTLRGQPLKQIIKQLKIKRWQIPRLVIKAKRSLALKMISISPFPDIPEALKQLHGNGSQMFILSTNSTQSISGFLKKNGLDGYFTRIYGDIGLRSKSSALKKLMKKESLDPKKCIYVGDEVRDIEAAKKAGIGSVGVTWGFNDKKAIVNAQPDFVADSPKNLAEYLIS